MPGIILSILCSKKEFIFLDHLVFTNTYLETLKRIVWTLRCHLAG